MRLSVKKLFQIFLVLFGIGFGLMMIFVLLVIADAPLERLERVSVDRAESRSDGSLISFEKGSLVSSSEFSFFMNFSGSSKSASRFLLDSKESGDISPLKGRKGQLEIQKDIQVKDLLQNNCDRIYCYQHRINFDKIPSLFWKGLIGIEDYRFLDHFGVDLKSIVRAAVIDIIEMKVVQGGSTLTQQLVKNLFYSNEKKLSRKLKEMIVAIYIESKYPKENILEAYFNEVFWGSLGGMKIKGIYAASLFYFEKRPDEINPYEASILIGLLKGPNFYRPLRHLDRLVKRTNVVFNKLTELNLFPGNPELRWKKKKWESWRDRLKKISAEKWHLNMWKSLKNNQDLLNRYEKFIFIHKASKVMSFIEKRAPDQDMAIKAYIASPNEKDKRFFSFYSKFERSKKTAIEVERHQVGSTLKPILYSYFLNYDYKIDDLVSTEEIKLDLISGKWSPREAHKNLPKEVSIGEALAKSYNRPVIRIANEIGFDALEKDLDPIIPRLQKPLGEYPAQLLGAVELSLTELHKIYKGFIYKECGDGLSVENPNILYLLSDPKQTTIRLAVGSEIGKQRFFGKTGTSNKGFDNWFIFYDGVRLGVIWVGLEGNRDVDQFKLYGSNTSFKIFETFVRDGGRRFGELGCEILGEKTP